MTVVVKQVGNEPIILCTIYEPVDMSVDPQKNRDLSNTIARKFTVPVYRIIDFTNFELTFEQLVAGLSEDIRFSESNIVMLIVGRDELVKFQTDVMAQQQYGGREAHYFTSVDDALAFARKRIQG